MYSRVANLLYHAGTGTIQRRGCRRLDHAPWGLRAQRNRVFLCRVLCGQLTVEGIGLNVQSCVADDNDGGKRCIDRLLSWSALIAIQMTLVTYIFPHLTAQALEWHRLPARICSASKAHGSIYCPPHKGWCTPTLSRHGKLRPMARVESGIWYRWGK